jgi:hypothetical protein
MSLFKTNCRILLVNFSFYGNPGFYLAHKSVHLSGQVSGPDFIRFSLSAAILLVS